eukprot:m.342393 g.342393  ORF g.342393 m.342393 type:complete len:166 (+) comp21332_c0_seq1:369-866(+)
MAKSKQNPYVSDIVYAGFLVKQGKIVKNWKLRYFELSSDDILRYYRSPPPKEGRSNISDDLAGEIKLADCREVLDHSHLQDINWPEKVFPVFAKQNHGFGVVIPGRTYFICGESVEEVNRWKAEIIKRCPLVRKREQAPEKPERPRDSYDALDEMLKNNPAIETD